MLDQWKNAGYDSIMQWHLTFFGMVGGYVRYPDIKAKSALLEDGVHLNSLGSCLFINTITGALETFALAHKSPKGCKGLTYPDQCV